MTALGGRTADLFERGRRVNPHAVDAFLALAFTVAALWTVAERVGEHGAYRSDDSFGIALLMLQTLPIAVRSVTPVAALAVSVAAVTLHIGVGYEGAAAGTLAALVIVYSAAAQTDVRRGILAGVITGAGVIFYFVMDRGNPTPTAAVSTFATYAAGWGLGLYVRSRREYTSVVEERAGLLEREREVRAREAVAEERVRIARELHDMVGHAMNLIVIQSGAAQRVFNTKPDLASESLASIESTSRQALTEMERLLGILRGTEEGDDPSGWGHGLGEVGKLADQVSEAGLPVEVTVEGTPPEILPRSIDLSAYRIIQEALTNALKYAGPASAHVAIRYGRDDIDLEITDDGRGVSSGGAGDGKGGRGLVGMRERAGLFGGELIAGPRPEGGFRVRARLPLGDDA